MIVLWDAFQPKPSDNMTSVARTLDLTEAEIWDIGKQLSNKPFPPLGARADFVAQNALDIGLLLLPDPLPERHTNIAGWPPKEEDVYSLAQALAAASTLKLVA
jgi:hypothetical protein